MSVGTAAAACAIGAVLLGACTDIRFGYGQGERVLAWTAQSYVSLDARQQQAVAEQLAALGQWHCATQPAGYAAWVRQAAADFAPGLTAERVAARADGLEYFARLLIAEAVPRMAVLVQRLSDRQARELERNLHRAGRAYRARVAQRTPPEAQMQRRDRMQRYLEDWIGPLSPPQRQMVTTWSTTIQPVGGEVYASSTLPAIALRSALRLRRDRDVLETELRALLLAPDRRWTHAGDPRFASNRQETWQLLAQIAAVTDDTQRQRLTHKAELVAAGFERLACGPRPRGR